MRSKTSHQNKFLRFLTLPIRVLGKARDFYVRSMTDCAEKVSYGSFTAGGPSGQVSSLPKSFSVSSGRSSSDSDDLRELIRVASTRALGNRVDQMDLYTRHQTRRRRPPTVAPVEVVPRSCSVGMGRIDEDRPCDFGDDYVNGRPDSVFPRSRSYAVPKRSVVF